jgi:hypothetical protein
MVVVHADGIDKAARISSCIDVLMKGVLDVAADEGGALIVEIGRGFRPSKAMGPMASIVIPIVSFAASSRNEPVPALQASFMA